jgi:hypothetical protein
MEVEELSPCECMWKQEGNIKCGSKYLIERPTWKTKM